MLPDPKVLLEDITTASDHIRFFTLKTSLTPDSIIISSRQLTKIRCT